MGPPGPQLPALVQTGQLWRDPAGFLERCRRAFGDAFELRIWPVGRLLVISSPELIAQFVLTPHDDLLTGAATRRLLPILGEGSLPALDGGEHAARRRILRPVFSGRRLAEHAGRTAVAVAAELADWPLDSSMRALPRLRSLTLALAAELVLGGKPPQLERLLHRYVAGRSALGTWFPVIAPARRTFERRRDELDRLLLESVREPPPGEHALAALLEAGLAEDTILEELRALLLVAHESTACALAWTLERLAHHPQVLERLREEEDRYLDAVAREVLRSRPPVLDAVRLAVRPLPLPNGRTISAGTIVMAAPLLVHHRPDLYPDPERFRPERAFEAKPPVGADIAFGGGERRCLGAQLATLELKALLRALADRYALAPARSLPEHTRLVATAVAPAAGAAITLSRRR
jgi:cytochrome P450 family 135